MRYILEKYHTPSSRHTCPKCGRKRCFTYYIDTLTGQSVDERCGKCDHLNSCGYHLPPRAFFGERNEGWKFERKDERKDGLSGVSPAPASYSICLPANLPVRCMGSETLLHSWLFGLFPRERVLQVAERYRLGQWRDHRVVFWQIDAEGRVRDGKLMDYGTDGHRLGSPSWVSAELRREGLIPAEASTGKCLFGLHLVPAAERQGTVKAEAPVVCLVESEKSALYCACRFPQFVWMATGGCKALKPEALLPLRGMKLVVFPDSGVHDEWADVLGRVPGLRYTLHNLDHLPGNTDLVDVMVNTTI